MAVIEHIKPNKDRVALMIYLKKHPSTPESDVLEALDEAMKGKFDPSALQFMNAAALVKYEPGPEKKLILSALGEEWLNEYNVSKKQEIK